MKIFTKSIGALALAMLAFGACGDDDNKGEDSPDAMTTPTVDAGVTDAMSEVDAALPLMGIDAICDAAGPLPVLFTKSSSCNANFSFLDILGTDLLDYQFVEELCRENVGVELATGDITVDESKIPACIAYINAASCEELDIDNLIGTPCDEIFVGSIAVDGECRVDSQCAGDSFCSPGKDCGTCQPRIALGEACTIDESCSAGNCNVMDQCAAPISQGGACTESSDCAGQLACNPDSQSCVSIAPVVGDRCLNSDQCGELLNSLYCQLPQLAGGGPQIPGTCQLLPSVGQACVLVPDFGGPGRICDLRNYDWCDEGTCAAPVISAMGEQCNLFPIAVGSGARKCDSGLLCSDPFGEGGVGTCVAAGQNGDVCDEEIAKVQTLFCHPFYNCTQAGMCELDVDTIDSCPGQ